MLAETDDSPDLDDYLTALRRRKGTIALTMFLVIGAALAVSLARPAVYEATARVNAPTPIAAGAAADEVDIIHGDDARASVRDEVGDAPNVEIHTTPGSRVIVIVANDQNANAAAKVANAYADAYADVRQGAVVTHKATVPDQAVEPDPVRNAIVAAVVGLVLGIALAWLFEFANGRVRTRRDAERCARGATTLGLVNLDNGYRAAAANDLAAIVVPRSSVATEYRALASSVGREMLDRPGRSLLVTTAGPDEGGPTVVGNLAVQLARSGLRVSVISFGGADPGIPGLFDIPDDRGLASVIDGSVPLSGAVVGISGVEYLTVLTAGLGSSAAVVNATPARIAETLTAVRAGADVVLVDSPPPATAPVSAAIAALVDTSVLVVAVGRTRSKALRRACRTLREAGTNKLGLIVVDTDSYFDEAEDEAGEQDRDEPAVTPRVGAR
jgi:Mrp family chromosome partitioning ATPase